MNMLVLFSYGSLGSVDDVADFYYDILHGHATESYIKEGVRKYKAYGMADPLGANTKRVGRALVKYLQKETREEWITMIGNRHTSPSFEALAQECALLNPKRIITFSLTPFDSVTGKNAYEKKFEQAFRVENQVTPITHVRPFFDNQLFTDVLIDRAKTAQTWLPAAVRPKAEIVFTVHSKPGTPKGHQQMIAQYTGLAKQIAAALAVENYHIAYRSGQPAPQRWLGPDVLDVVSELGNRGVEAVMFIELLSVIENIEVIQEITKDAIEKAHSLGMEAVQSEYLNDSTDFVEALADHLISELHL